MRFYVLLSPHYLSLSTAPRPPHVLDQCIRLRTHLTYLSLTQQTTACKTSTTKPGACLSSPNWTTPPRTPSSGSGATGTSYKATVSLMWTNNTSRGRGAQVSILHPSSKPSTLTLGLQWFNGIFRSSRLSRVNGTKQLGGLTPSWKTADATRKNRPKNVNICMKNVLDALWSSRGCRLEYEGCSTRKISSIFWRR